MREPHLREPMRPADKTGTHGRAWKCDHVALRRKRRKRRFTEVQDATLGVWIVERSDAHPAWHSYAIALMHLRPMAGFDDPVIHRKGATHELMVMALDPTRRRDHAVAGKEFPAYLTPANFAAQLAEPTDEAAITQIEAAIDLILAGELNPDTDARRQWIALFGDHMLMPEAR